MSSRHKKNRSRTRPENVTTFPNAYPPVPGYPMPGQQWIPPHPGTGYPYQWYQPWSNMPPLTNPNVSWMPPNTSISTGGNVSSPKSGIPTEGSDEFTVDSLRRIYNNDEGSIEIERVKVQRRQGIYDTKANAIEYHSDSHSLVPVSSVVLNERRPPPRKNKRRAAQVKNELLKPEDAVQPQGWFPYMPYFPQPFPYPYQYGYMWPMPPPPSSSTIPPRYNSPTDESDESSISHTKTGAHGLMKDKSLSPELPRPSSSAATSHVTESLGTDIAPSDSVSMRGFKREISLERILGKSLSNANQPNHLSSGSNDMEKTKEWMEDMQKAFELKADLPSDTTGDRSSFATATSDIPTPPTRMKIYKEPNNKPKISRRKSNSESNIDNQDEQKVKATLPLLDNARVSDPDILYALKNQEQIPVTCESHDPKYGEHLANNYNKRKGSREQDGRTSRSSTMSFHSTKQSADDNQVDTDSTDIALPIDSSTADESIDNFDDGNGVEDDIEQNYKWILQQVGDVPENRQSNDENKEDNGLIDNWRTEVSLWRARLVVSLCRGQGLDQQDWATFQLLVQHPLQMDLKLSLLHAHRICSNNYDVGVAMLRNALLHLTTFGESLMKPENERHSGWKNITIDANQPWAPMKGSSEILRVFGYRMRGDGTLRHRRKSSPEVSVIARLTLDLLVLAEEFRLFLTGAHQYPANITQLFTPRESHADKYIGDYHQVEKHKQSKPNFDDSFEIRHEAKTDEIFADSRKHESDYAKKRQAPLPPTDAVSECSGVSFEESNFINRLDEPISPPPPSETLSSTTSIPELHSPTQASSLMADIDDIASGSRETLTPSPTLEITEDGSSEQNGNELETETEENSTQNESKSRRKSGNGKDNPEDHIYEEIGDIKAQVYSLKERDSMSQSPPPLPPKTKSSSQNQDIYPHMDWSISSQYSSVHGGSGARRKKRRAPMPPEFLNFDFKEIESSNSVLENNDNPSLLGQQTTPDHLLNTDNINNLNSRYTIENTNIIDEFSHLENEVKGTDSTNSEMTNKLTDSTIQNSNEIVDSSVQKQLNESSSISIQGNIKSKVEKPYDGNPFYEDRIAPSGYIGKNPFYEDVTTKPADSLQMEKSDISNVSLPPTEKQENSYDFVDDSKRMQKPNVLKDYNEDISEFSEDLSPSVAVRPQRRKDKNSTLKKVQSDKTENLQTEPNIYNNEKSSNNSSSSSVATLKNVEIEENLDLVSQNIDNHKNRAVKPNMAQKNDPREQQDDSQVVVPINNVKPELKPKIKETKDHQGKEVILHEILITYDITFNDSDSSSDKPTESISIKQKDKIKDSISNMKEDISKPHSTGEELVNKLNKTEVITDTHEDKESSATIDRPPVPPPKAALRLIYDIPYIDTNDVKMYKRTYSVLERKQPSHYGLSALHPRCDSNLELSNNEAKTSTFLKRSSFVPFIDDADIPPDAVQPTPPSNSTFSSSSSPSSTVPHTPPSNSTFPSSLSPSSTVTPVHSVASSNTQPTSCTSTPPIHPPIHVSTPQTLSSSPTLTNHSPSSPSTTPPHVSSISTPTPLTPVPLSSPSTLPPHVPLPSNPTPSVLPPASPTSPPPHTLSSHPTQPLPPSSSSTSPPQVPLSSPPTPPILPPPSSTIPPPHTPLHSPPTPPLHPPPSPPTTPPPHVPLSSPPTPPLLPPPSPTTPPSHVPLSSPPTPPLLPPPSPTTPPPHVPLSSPPTPPLLPPPSPPSTLLSLSHCDVFIPISSPEEDKGIPFADSDYKGTTKVVEGEQEINVDDQHIGESKQEDSEHKTAILFGKDEKPKATDPCVSTPDAEHYEIPEQVKETADFEERYEIPDVTRANASAKVAPPTAGTERASRRPKEGPPRRPPRHLLLMQIVPPRPPKPIDKDTPPKLPPKTGSLTHPRSASDPPTSSRSSSLPSTITKEGLPPHPHSHTPRPTSATLPTSPSFNTPTPSTQLLPKSISQPLPSTYPSSTSSKPHLHPPSRASYPSYPSSPPSKSTSVPSYPSYPSSPPSKSTSVPSSPLAAKHATRVPSKGGKKQRSWPSLLCDCVHPNSSSEDVKYVLK